jgi:hypothetical protein
VNCSGTDTCNERRKNPSGQEALSSRLVPTFSHMENDVVIVAKELCDLQGVSGLQVNRQPHTSSRGFILSAQKARQA